MSDFNVALKITADSTQAQKALRDINGELSAVSRQRVRVDADTAGIENAIGALGRLSTAGGDRSVRVDADTAGVDDATRALGDLAGAASAEHSLEIGADTQALEDASARIEQLEQQLNGAGGQATGFMDVIKGVGATLLGAFTIDAIAANTVDLINFNKEINQMNEYLFVSREALQVWGAAGEQYGVEIADALKDVQERIGEFAATGGGEAKDVFEPLKISVNDLIALSPDQQLLKIAEAMSKIKDMSAGEKSFLLESLASDLTKIAPLLDNNAAKLREIDAIMRESGAIITADQNEVLTEAANNLMLLETALTGMSNGLGMIGASIFNVFGEDVAWAIATTTAALTEMVAIGLDEGAAIGDAWADAFANMPPAAEAAAQAAGDAWAWIAEAFDWVVAGLGQGVGEIVELFRVGFTYLPQFGMAAFQALIDYGLSWAHTAAAGFDAVKAVAGNAFAALVDFAGKAFGEVAGIAGQVVGYVIGRLADMAAAVGGALSGMAFVPGMEGLSANVAGVEARLRGMAGAAKDAGAAVTGNFSAMAGSIRAAANESLAGAKISALQAQNSKLSAQHALVNAHAMMMESEGNRTRTIEMGKAERQFARLGSSISGAGASSKNHRINQDAVNKAMGDGAGKADKAAKATKGKSDADKAAAKAATELEKAQKKVADAYDREYERLESQIIKYRDGEDALYKYKLTKDGLNDGMQATLIGMKAEAEALEGQHKAREKTQKAYEKAIESLDDEYAKLTLSTEGYIRHKLAVDGITGAKQDELAARQMAVDQLSKETKIYEQAADNLLKAFDGAIMEGKSLFEGLKDWALNLFNDLVLRPVLQPITNAAMQGMQGAIAGKSNPWEGLKNAGMQTWSGMQAGGMSGAFTAAGAAGGLVGLLGGTKQESIGASIGAGIGNVLLPGLGGVIGGALGGLAGSLFGRKWETTGSGLSLQYGGGDVSGQSYIESTKKGGLFSSTKRKTEYSALESALDQQLDAYFDAVETGIVSQSGELVKLGISGGSVAAQSIVDGFTTSLQKLDLTGKSDGERQTIIDNWANGIADDLYRSVVGADTFAAMDALAVSGESTGDTFARLVTQFTTLDTIAKNLNLQFNATGTAALTAANSLANAFGGLENLTAATDYYYQNFFTEEERKSNLLQAANDDLYGWNTTLGLVGDAAIDTSAEMRAYVSSLDLTTDAGQKAYRAAMGYAQAVLTVAGAQSEAAEAAQASAAAQLQSAQAAQQQQADVFSQYWSGIEAVTSRYQDDLAALESSYSDQKRAYDSAISAATGLRNALNSTKLTDLSPLTPKQKLDEAQRQWDVLLTAANAGDVGAAESMKAAGETLLALKREYYASSDPYTSGFNDVLAGWESVAGLLEGQKDPQQEYIAGQQELIAKAEREYARLSDIFAGIVGGNDLQRLALAQISGLPSELAGQLKSTLEGLRGVSGTAKLTAADDARIATDKAAAFTDQAAQIISLYQTLLGRLPDTSGLGYWVNALTNGFGLDNVATSMSQSAEYKNSHYDGLASVPYDGYQATLHKGEAVIDARAAFALRKYGIGVSASQPVTVNVDTNDLVAEVKALRDEVRMLRAENAQQATKAEGQRGEQLRQSQQTDRALVRGTRAF